MFTYKTTSRCPHCGSAPQRIPVLCFCDATGVPIDPTDVGFPVVINFDYGTVDACFGTSDVESAFLGPVDVAVFLSDPYVVADNVVTPDGLSPWEKVYQYAMRGNPRHEVLTIDEALRELRCLTATRLLADGVIKASDLAGYF